MNILMKLNLSSFSSSRFKCNPSNQQQEEEIIQIQINNEKDNFNVPFLKQQLFNHIPVPPQFLVLLWGGKVLYDSFDLSQIPIFSDNIHIQVLVDEKFQSFQPSARYRCPLSGYLFSNPVLAKPKNGNRDKKVFSKNSLDEWVSGRHTAYCAFDNELIYSSSKLDEVLNQEIKNYLSTITHENMKISSINSFGNIFSILEPVNQYLSNYHNKSDNNNDNFDENSNVESKENDKTTKKETKETITINDGDYYLSKYGLDFIPAIVIIGEEKTGKSSLSQRLTMNSLFPKAIRLCTNLVTIIKFRKGPYKPIQMRTVYHNTQNTKSNPTYIAAGNAHINVLKAMPEEVSGDQHLEIEITHPFAPNLDFYDYPGLSSGRDNTSIMNLLGEHVLNHNHRSVYLYSISSIDENRDPTSSSRQRLSEVLNQFQQIKDRTVVVFTQADLASSERLKELQTLSVEHESIVGCDLPWGHVLTMANYNGITDDTKELERGNDETNDDIEENNNNNNVNNRIYTSHQELFGKLEIQAMKEIDYFEKNNVKGGCNKLVSILHSMLLTILEEYLSRTINKLQSQRTRLLTEYSSLGDLEAHEYSDLQAKSLVCRRFISDASDSLHREWNKTTEMFEDEYLEEIQSEITTTLQTKSFATRGELDIYLREAKQKIVKFCEFCFERERDFWSRQIHRILFTNNTPFKMSRFPEEIEVISKYVECIVIENHEVIKRKLDRFIDLHFDNFSGSFEIVKNLTESNKKENKPKFTLKFNSILHQLLVQIFSSTLSCFDESLHLFSTENLNSLLQSCSFIESNRQERYETLQELAIIDTTLNKIQTLQTNVEIELIRDVNDLQNDVDGNELDFFA